MYFYHSISEISSRYDAFIVDLWGVIHDGKQLYPHALDALKGLKAAGKTVLFLSNAPRRAARICEALTAMGITENYYDGVVSSGELCYQALAFPKEEPFITLSKGSYAVIGPARDRGVLAGSGLVETDKLEEAGFIVAVGFDRDDSSLDEKIPELHTALTAGIPMICANPDKLVVKQTGERSLCAGVLAALYEEQGGKVYYFGKPYPQVYDACFAQLATVEKSRILAIGDSLDTDIRGAQQAGIDALLVAGGILAEELIATPYGDGVRKEKLETLCAAYQATPHYVLPDFRWV